jgi:hypothetical protein
MKFAGLPAVTHRSWHQFRLIPTLDEIHYTVKGALFAKAEARSVGVMLGHREVCWFCLS